MFDINQKVDINISDKKIDEVLDELLANTDIKYAVRDRQILLVNKEAESAMGLQQNKMTGIVTNKNGEPLAGVNVVITGTALGAITGADGKYSIEVPNGSKSLTFSFIGMESQQVNIALHASTFKESVLSMPLVYKIAILFVDVLNLMASIIVLNMAKKMWKERRDMLKHYY